MPGKIIIKGITSCLLWLTLITGLTSQSRTEHHVIESNVLGERRAISVSVPDDYDRMDEGYPVLVLLDGELIFSYARGTVDFFSNDFGFFPERLAVGNHQ